MHRRAALPPQLASSLLAVFARFPRVDLALVFGSLADGRATPQSDIDIAVAAATPLSSEERAALIGALAEATGRPVDLVDLATAPEPLLGQVVQHGRRVLGADEAFAKWLNRHLVEQADFVPYRDRILSERRRAWIGK